MAIDDILLRKEPLFYLVTPEESRAEREIWRWCDAASPAKPLFRWTSTRGLERLQGGVVEPVRLPDEDPRIQAQAPLVPVLKYAVHDCPEDGVFLLKDVHHFLRGGGSQFNPPMALTTRALRDAYYELRDLGKPRKLVLLAPELVIPPDLEKELRIVDFPLPSRDVLMVSVRKMLRRAEAIHQQDPKLTFRVQDMDRLAHALVDAAVGLTEVEVQYLLENMLYVERALTDDAPRRMIREKQQIIRKSGVLEFIPAEDLADLRVGGLEAMLDWLRLRRHVLENRERARSEFGIKEIPRGVLFVGIPGCGKSLVCKRIAYEWSLPLLRLDVGAIFDRWLGASEDRIRRALAVAESVAPCILWIDEIEKGFNAAAGGDGGTSARVLGTFLVWMQEKKAPVFVAATANDISLLPPELLRSGRFDNRFFVGCPSDIARREIFEIHLTSRKLDPKGFDLDRLVELTFGFTGAEIEQVVLDSAYDAFYEERRASMEDLLHNIGRTRPLIKSLGPQLNRVLRMLDEGRMELASRETVLVELLVERLHIDLD